MPYNLIAHNFKWFLLNSILKSTSFRNDIKCCIIFSMWYMKSTTKMFLKKIPDNYIFKKFLTNWQKNMGTSWKPETKWIASSAMWVVTGPGISADLCCPWNWTSCIAQSVGDVAWGARRSLTLKHFHFFNLVIRGRGF